MNCTGLSPLILCMYPVASTVPRCAPPNGSYIGYNNFTTTLPEGLFEGLAGLEWL